MSGEIHIYTDGACSGNPGPGGWAAILVWNSHEKELAGFEPDTTNNRMELRAAIEALKSIKRKSLPVRIVTDSRYLQDAFTKNWIQKWIQNGWKTSQKEPVKNQDLWQELIILSRTIKINWEWTEGHSGHEYNERCDALAREQIKKRMKR